MTVTWAALAATIVVTYLPLQNHCTVSITENGKAPAFFKAKTSDQEGQVREALLLVLGRMA